MSIEILNRAVSVYGTKAEVARLLGISAQRLNGWFAVGKLPQGWNFKLEERLSLYGTEGVKTGKRTAKRGPTRRLRRDGHCAH